MLHLEWEAQRGPGKKKRWQRKKTQGGEGKKTLWEKVNSYCIQYCMYAANKYVYSVKWHDQLNFLK